MLEVVNSIFRKYILPYLFPVLAFIGVINAVGAVRAGETKPVPPTPLIEPSTSPYKHFVAGVGVVESSSENIAIASPVSGVVAEVYVQSGDDVEKGEALFRIDAREIEADVKAKEAALAVTQAELSSAQNLLALRESVADKRAVTLEELTSKRYGVQIAQAKYTQAENLLLAARTELERRTIRSPIDGKVLQCRVKVGEFAPLQIMATPLMVVGDVTPLRLRVEIDENDSWRLQEGSEALSYLRGNREIKSDLRFIKIEPLVVPKKTLTGESSERVDTRVMQVVFELESQFDDVHLYPGQIMDVYIKTSADLAVEPKKDQETK